MRIVKLVVIDEDGDEQTYVGEGHISPVRTQSNSKPKQPLVVGVTAHISWTPVEA